MDTTEKYIKMCEKATEIQEQWKPEYYDVVNPKGYNAVQNIVNIGKIGKDEYIVMIPGKKDWIQLNELIWLPRQDQLQAMFDGAMCDYHLVNIFYEFIRQDEDAYGAGGWCIFVNSASMEQLWLVFVMKNKFNKIWSNEEWVDVKEQKN